MGSQPCKAKTDYKPQRTITIQGGDVILSDKSVCVRPRAIVHFQNLDPESYAIVFGVFGEDPYDPTAHADVDLFLPGYGSSTMVADLDIVFGECSYLIVPAPLDSIGTAITEELVEPMIVNCEVTQEQVRGTTVPRGVMRDKSAARGGPGGTIHVGG
jgi:hypothetical protein